VVGLVSDAKLVLFIDLVVMNLVRLKEFLIALNQPVVISNNKRETKNSAENVFGFHRSGSNENGDFNDFRKFIVVKLVTIIAHPLIILSEDVGVFFSISKILIQVSIKTRRAIFTTSTIRKRSSFRQSFVIPTSIRPETRNVPKIDQFCNFLIGIEVFYKFHSVEFGISIKMAID
jgi:hypothetical protein